MAHDHGDSFLLRLSLDVDHGLSLLLFECSFPLALLLDPSSSKSLGVFDLALVCLFLRLLTTLSTRGAFSAAVSLLRVIALFLLELPRKPFLGFYCLLDVLLSVFFEELLDLVVVRILVTLWLLGCVVDGLHV